MQPGRSHLRSIDPGEGVALSTVNPKGLFGQAGLEPKDFVLQFNGQAIKGVDGFAELLNALPAKQPLVVLALDHRSGQLGYVQMTLN